MRNKSTAFLTALVAGIAVVSTAGHPAQEQEQDLGAPIGLIEPFNSYVTVYDENNVEPMRPDIFGTHGSSRPATTRPRSSGLRSSRRAATRSTSG